MFNNFPVFKVHIAFELYASPIHFYVFLALTLRVDVSSKQIPSRAKGRMNY